MLSWLKPKARSKTETLIHMIPFYWPRQQTDKKEFYEQITPDESYNKPSHAVQKKNEKQKYNTEILLILSD